MKVTPDVIALGSCYYDMNVGSFPFPDSGIPVETEIIGDAYETVPGGSAVNFCRILGELGTKSAFIGMAGEDDFGELLLKRLEKEGIQPELIRQSGLVTNIGFNMTNPNGKHIMLIAGTANKALSPDFALPKLDGLLDSAKMLYLGGCFKLKTFAGAFEDIVQLASRHTTDLVVDHGRIPNNIDNKMLEAVKRLALGASYYFPSRDEFCQLWQFATIEAGLQLLHEKASKVTVVVKDGSNGAFYMANGTVQHAVAEKIYNVVNLTGAGDSFNAGVMAAILRNQPLTEAVAYGCRVAGAKVAGLQIPELTTGVL